MGSAFQDVYLVASRVDEADHVADRSTVGEPETSPREELALDAVRTDEKADGSDRSGSHGVLRADRPPTATDDAATTNHQAVVEWRPYCDAIRSEERLEVLSTHLDNGDSVAEVTEALLHDPLYATNFHHGCGTLYTAVIRPEARSVTYVWPGYEPWTHRLDQPRNDQMAVTLNSSFLGPGRP